MMRRVGVKACRRIERVKAEVAKINSSQTSCRRVSTSGGSNDRTELINITTHTVLHNMIFGIVLIFFVQWMFLGDLRSAIIVSDYDPVRTVLLCDHHSYLLRGESGRICCQSARSTGLINGCDVSIMVENMFRIC